MFSREGAGGYETLLSMRRSWRDLGVLEGDTMDDLESEIEYAEVNVYDLEDSLADDLTRDGLDDLARELNLNEGDLDWD